MAIEIVDYPLKTVIFHSYVSLPEGIHKSTGSSPFSHDSPTSLPSFPVIFRLIFPIHIPSLLRGMNRYN